jgi:hypothetical protein
MVLNLQEFVKLTNMKQPTYKRGTYNKPQEKKVQLRVQIFKHEKESIINFIKSLRNGN